MRVVWTTAVLLLVLLLNGCGAGDSADTSTEDAADDASAAEPESDLGPVTAEYLDGASFISTEVTGRELVTGSRIRLDVEGETMSVSAGCNVLFSALVLEDDELRWVGEPAQTLKACSDELAEQDQWLTELFTAGVTVARTEIGLSLAGADVEMQLASITEQDAETDLEELFGRRWVVIETVRDDVSERIPASVPTPYLDVAEDGSVELFTGCNTGATTAELQDGVLVFSAPRITRKGCDDATTRVERAVLDVLDGALDEVVVSGTTLVLARSGVGLVLEVL